MLKNHITIATRNLLKDRIYTIINILGLSVGMAGSLLILLYVEDEFSFDKFHSDSDNIYKFVLERTYPDHSVNYAIVPHSFSEVMLRDFPEVKNAVRLMGDPSGEPIVVEYIDSVGTVNSYDEPAFMVADSTFFELFDFKLTQGDPKKALSSPQDIVITQSAALKYFGKEDPIGKILRMDFGEFIVSGVCEDVPENSHFDFDLLAALVTFPFIEDEVFTGFSTHLYLQLQPGADPRQLQSKFPKMVETYAAPEIEADLNVSFEEYTASGNGYHYSLLPLEDIHCSPVEYKSEFRKSNSINNLYIFMVVALMVMFMACINFVNLATARSAERAREVGIRKTLGSLKKQLVAQFLAESVLLSILAAIVAVGITYFALSYFNDITDKSLDIFAKGSFVVPVILAYTLIVGLLAGSYPALVLSSQDPVTIMKGDMRTRKSTAWLRNGLIVFQFVISIILVSGMLVVDKQMKYVSQMELGYDPEHVVLIERAWVLAQPTADLRDVFVEELEKLPQVAGAGGISVIPTSQVLSFQLLPPDGAEVIYANAISADDRYVETMKLEMVAGRSFSKNFNDSLSIIINERVAQLLGVDDPIGMKVKNPLIDVPEELYFEVIGVVKDFHYESAKTAIDPFVMTSTKLGLFDGIGAIAVRIDGGDVPAAISAIEEKWNEFSPGSPLRYKFLTDELSKKYRSETNARKILELFAVLGMVIACIGLLGLVTYMVGLRTREIAIRKTLGASTGTVVYLLSWDFTKLILIALVIAVPVSYYLISEWLAGFAYRTEPGIVLFPIAGGLALLIAWLTISFQTVRAAMANPVKSLHK